ncbi:MAG: glycosyltransferase family 4 protein, partial [bacterium]
KKRLAIISSHPIQYNAPLFALLAGSEKLEIRVFYTWSQSRESLFDKDFGKTIQWDIPLLDGYPYEFVPNISPNPGPGSYRGIVCPELNVKIAGWGAEALLVYGWNYHAHYHAMRHFKGRIPVYFRGDSTLLDETGGMKQFMRRLFLRWIYRKADYAFYVGENNRRYFLEHGFREDHLFFAPHAIDNRRFSDPEGKLRPETEKWKGELGIAGDDKVILFVGKFEPKKDPLLLIRAALELNKPGLHYLFVGNGALEPQMRSLAEGKKGFHFIPFQNQSRMPVVYHMSNILVLPSQGPGETWGLVVNEAMACGKAVLVSDRTGCAIDLVRPGENGFVIPSGDAGACAGKLDLMTTGDVSRKMGMVSEKIISAWSFEAIRESFETNIVP